MQTGRTKNPPTPFLSKSKGDRAMIESRRGPRAAVEAAKTSGEWLQMAIDAEGRGNVGVSNACLKMAIEKDTCGKRCTIWRVCAFYAEGSNCSYGGAVSGIG